MRELIERLVCKHVNKGHWFVLHDKIGLKMCFFCHTIQEME